MHYTGRKYQTHWLLILRSQQVEAWMTESICPAEVSLSSSATFLKSVNKWISKWTDMKTDIQEKHINIAAELSQWWNRFYEGPFSNSQWHSHLTKYAETPETLQPNKITLKQIYCDMQMNM